MSYQLAPTYLSRCLRKKRFLGLSERHWAWTTILGELSFFSICKTEFTLQTHYLQQDSCLHSCFLPQACQGSVFWMRQCVQQHSVRHQPRLKLYVNSLGKKTGSRFSFDFMAAGSLYSTETRWMTRNEADYFE